MHGVQIVGERNHLLRAKWPPEQYKSVETVDAPVSSFVVLSYSLNMNEFAVLYLNAPGKCCGLARVP